MRKAAFFYLMFFTWYLAGMYRSRPLMTLCLAELALLVILFIQSRYFRTKLSVFFPKRSEAAEARTDTVCRISILNSGKLPVSRMGLRLRIEYENAEESVQKLLYSSSERGESTLYFQACFRYCGLVQVRLDGIRAFDYLSLFSAFKPLSEEMIIAVFPGTQALSITANDLYRNESRLNGEQTLNHPGDAYHEIRQIREYRTGDSSRHIHWNQSAKTARLWIREYEKKTDSAADVFADTAGFAGAPQIQRSAFYRLLSALVFGLLKEAAAVRVSWYIDKKNGLVNRKTVCSADECRDMLFSLYQADFTGAGAAPSGEYDFRLTLSLALFCGDTLLYQFSRNDLEQEIEEKVFIF